jgi:hypothetical protein
MDFSRIFTDKVCVEENWEIIEHKDKNRKGFFDPENIFYGS